MSEGGENREKSDEAKLQMSELEQDDFSHDSHEERESKRRKLDNGEESAQQIVSRQSSPAPNPLKEEEPFNSSEQIPPKSPNLSVPSPKRSSPRPDIVGVPEPSDVLNVLPAATLGPIDGTDNELLEQPCSASIGSFAPPVMKDEVIEMADGTVSEATPVPDKNESEMVKAGDVSTPAAADSPAREKDEISSAKGKTKSALASKSQTAKGKKAPAKKGRAKTKVRMTFLIISLPMSMVLINVVGGRTEREQSTLCKRFR